MQPIAATTRPPVTHTMRFERPRLLRRAAAVVGLAVVPLMLTACSTGSDSAFGYGQGDGTGSTSSVPMQYEQRAVIGVTLDNHSDQPVELLSLTPLKASNITVGTSTVAPVLKQRDGSWLSFGVNQPTDDYTLIREWSARRPAAGYRITAKQKSLQGLLQISVRDRSRPARVVGIVIRYRQDGQVRTETTGETACFFTPHRDSACSLPS